MRHTKQSRNKTRKARSVQTPKPLSSEAILASITNPDACDELTHLLDQVRPQTARRVITKAVSVWLSQDLDVIDKEEIDVAFLVIDFFDSIPDPS